MTLATPLRVSVFDYGAGNLHSLVKSLETPDTVVTVESDARKAVRDTDALVLPGVGAFRPAAERLADGLDDMRRALENGLPCLGICLGMQLLFERSDEGPGDGLAVFAGAVTKLDAERTPHIGWNAIEAGATRDALLDTSALQMAYYANSFVARPTAASIGDVIAWSEHEHDRFPAIVRRGNIVGTQFHPEKSSVPGVRFVHAFLQQASEARR